MTVYADTPLWARHGTVWGHLISDSSLEELHERAALAGLPPRAFDLDHYDWPASQRPHLERTGVVFVDGRELTRILIASGLRVPLVERPAARARRTARGAALLGLKRVPRDLILGLLGHVDPLADEPGAYRLSRDDSSQPPLIEAWDQAGRDAAAAFLSTADAASRSRGEAGFIGQVMDVALRPGPGSSAG